MYIFLKAYFTHVYRNPDVYIFFIFVYLRERFYRKLMPILHRDNCYILVGRILLFVWDAHFYVGMSTLIVKTRKISLFAWDAYFHSGMPIFTVKLGTRMPIFT